MKFKVKKIGQYKVILDNNNDPIDVWDEQDMLSATDENDEPEVEILDGELDT